MVQAERALLERYSGVLADLLDEAARDGAEITLPADLVDDAQDVQGFVDAQLGSRPAGVMRAAHALHATPAWYEEMAAAVEAHGLGARGNWAPGETLLEYVLKAIDDGMRIPEQLVDAAWETARRTTGAAAGDAVRLMVRAVDRGCYTPDFPLGSDARVAVIDAAYAVGGLSMFLLLLTLQPPASDAEVVQLLHRAIADARIEDAASIVTVPKDNVCPAVFSAVMAVRGGPEVVCPLYRALAGSYASEPTYMLNNAHRYGAVWRAAIDDVGVDARLVLTTVTDEFVDKQHHGTLGRLVGRLRSAQPTLAGDRALARHLPSVRMGPHGAAVQDDDMRDAVTELLADAPVAMMLFNYVVPSQLSTLDVMPLLEWAERNLAPATAARLLALGRLKKDAAFAARAAAILSPTERAQRAAKRAAKRAATGSD